MDTRIQDGGKCVKLAFPNVLFYSYAIYYKLF